MRMSDWSSDVCSSDLEILLRETRASDVVGRLGGDEFGVILAQSALEPAAAKAAKLADTIAAEGAVWDGHALPVSVAYGAHTLRRGPRADGEIGRASCRERVCQYG